MFKNDIETKLYKEISKYRLNNTRKCTGPELCSVTYGPCPDAIVSNSPKRTGSRDNSTKMIVHARSPQAFREIPLDILLKTFCSAKTFTQLHSLIYWYWSKHPKVLSIWIPIKKMTSLLWNILQVRCNLHNFFKRMTIMISVGGIP